ncbi:putative leucine-rich repeat receptor-like serine/threonine-protein kinase [Camellia lanceoleosa]|uniref:Leucine-rich repeat receptor-like serine/threonine-protein kinase n=1 Tax=Camellia lanceoleosa TaxID=1840588 RepID=A0ACC0HKV4_9ERIC|nr:putative leucine-rich repeat receptor-like serine/threonine-protein kinase [Camellia lanceoleosa]
MHKKLSFLSSSSSSLNMFFPHTFTSLILFIYLATFASAATLLPPDEVEALKQIGKILGNNDWNFNGEADPCSWAKGPNNNVTCNCTSSSFCHITMISLKSRNLSGTLPTEFVKLRFLKVISLLGNRLTGSIPKEIGNISTLQHITLEFNQLSGPLPPELGNLSQINDIHLTSNYFTGTLPGTLAELITLTEFRVSGNQFNGKIPNFIQKWTNLKKLGIQASGLDGPIPQEIASLTKMTDLRISDLNGMESTFPHLNNMTNMNRLILRSCNMTGPLPNYLANLTKLKTLDLSFNKLKGEIPSNFVNLSTIEFIYLTGNFLSGPVPDSMLKYGKNIDLSYNNLSPGPQSCQQKNVNLFASSSNGNPSQVFKPLGIVSCLRSFQCPQNWSSFYINCGGRETFNGSTKYEDDLDLGGPAKFIQHGTNWAFSSTGHFLDDDSFDSWISTNMSRLSMRNSELYMDARLSPISLTYYGFCLLNGNYTVKLHFVEIMFTDDETFSSLGRRIFDIYIQGKLECKDFNIAKAAGGVNKETIQTFTAFVTNSTLEIRLYWAGRGTTGIPSRGVYGPLISAISVYNPDYVSKNKNSITVGAVVWIVAAVAFVIILLLGILWWRGYLLRKDTMAHDLKGLDLQTGSFTLRQLKAATNNFDVANKIGEGGFGSVYKGLLSDGTIIAVKQLSSKSKQGNRLKECQLKLDWETRYKICIGIAKGLAYLHEESRLKIVHRDIKATNVLLDKNLNSKISDFGLAKLGEEDDTHISTKIVGTYGYVAPEYAMRGYLTEKADVYSFGIVTLEIVSGRKNTNYRRKIDSRYLLDWALELKEKGKLLELVDPKLGPDFVQKEVIVMINVALLCTNVTPTVRPTMSSVVSMLEGRAVVEELVSDSTVFSHKMTLKGLMADLQHSHETDMNDSLIEMPLTAFFSSADY